MDYIPIRILGLNHLLYVAILGCVALLLLFNPKSVRANRRRITHTVLVINLLQQCLLYGYFIYFGSFTVAESLPLHLSRITSILAIIYLITKKRQLFSVIAYFSLFAWLSFLVPTDIQPITHPLGVSFLTNHVITLLLPFYMIIAYQIELKTSDKYVAYAWLSLYVISIYYLNPILGGNYFYLVNKPILNNLSDPVYLVGVYFISFLLFSIGEQIFKFANHYYIRKDVTL